MVQYSLTGLPGTAVALNDAGQVTGISRSPAGPFSETFVYDAGALNFLELGREAIPAAINTSGQVAGFWTQGGDNPTGFSFIWAPGTPVESLSGGGFDSTTSARAINDSDEIVGAFSAHIGIPVPAPDHAFFAKNGAVTIFEPLGATTSSAADINDAGQIVGSYEDGSGQSHGFVYETDTFTTTIAPPEADWSQATHINASGVIIGEYAVSGETPPDQEHAFIYDHGAITKLEAAGTSLSVATAINAAGDVVGYYDAGGQSHAFVYENGIAFTIDPPGATSASAVSVNVLGQVVGTYTDATGSHIFVYDRYKFTTIDEPGATEISAVAINDGGQVIGNCSDASGSHGFIADPLNKQRTWVGVASHDAGDPANWSPYGAPEPRDTLLLPSGSTIDIRGQDLQGDPLTLATEYGNTASTTLNLSNQADVTLQNGAATAGAAIAVVNVTGCDTLDLISALTNASPFLAPPLSVTVNLTSGAELDGTFDLDYGASLTVASEGPAMFINSGTDFILGSRVTIDAGVYGCGWFRVTEGGITPTSSSGGHLAFGSFVSKDQVIDVTGGVAGTFPPSVRTSEVDIADAHAFHGTLDLHDYSLADLAGLARADAWSYRNDMLTIFNGCGKVADKVHVLSDATTTGGVHGLSVSMDTEGRILISPGTDFHGSLGLTN